MKITTTCGYALSAMAHIAAQPAGSTVSNSSICKAANLPERYVLQVLRILVKEKMLVSVRGVAAGYKLERPASKITLLEVFEAIDGPVGAAHLVSIEGMSPESVRTIDKTVSLIAEDTRKRLAKFTLAELRSAAKAT